MFCRTGGVKGQPVIRGQGKRSGRTGRQGADCGNSRVRSVMGGGAVSGCPAGRVFYFDAEGNILFAVSRIQGRPCFGRRVNVGKGDGTARCCFKGRYGYADRHLRVVLDGNIRRREGATGAGIRVDGVIGGQGMRHGDGERRDAAVDGDAAGYGTRAGIRGIRRHSADTEYRQKRE